MCILPTEADSRGNIDFEAIEGSTSISWGRQGSTAIPAALKYGFPMGRLEL